MSPAGSPDEILRIEGVSKRFGATAAVDNVDLTIAAGEFCALLGPSGCGKTTLMRLIAGFEKPDAGRVLLSGADITAAPPYLRPLNMMFQSYALFPHMSVFDNIAFGLRQETLSRESVAARVEDMLKLVQLEALGARKPQKLSGGQRQRVALARALAKRPKLLLLDEPLAALDRKLRQETQFELTRIQKETGAAFLIVTHDQSEALAMASRIALMRNGRIEQVGAPTQIYERPANRWAAQFIGETNIFAGPCAMAGDGLARFDTADGPVLARADDGFRANAGVVAVRPERLVLSRDAPTEAVNRFVGVVADAIYRGDATLFRVRLELGNGSAGLAGPCRRLVVRARARRSRELCPASRLCDGGLGCKRRSVGLYWAPPTCGWRCSF